MQHTPVFLRRAAQVDRVAAAPDGGRRCAGPAPFRARAGQLSRVKAVDLDGTDGEGEPEVIQQPNERRTNKRENNKSHRGDSVTDLKSPP